MTINPTPAWQRAIHRALGHRVKPTLLADGTFRVPSASRTVPFHIVSRDKSGQIAHCSDCKGWAQGGRERPCWHAGACALAIAYLKGDHFLISTEEGTVKDFRPRGSFRTRVA